MTVFMGQAPPFSPPLSLLSEAPAVPRTSDSEKSSLDWRYYLLVQAQEEGEEVERRTSSQEGNKDSFFMAFVLIKSLNSTANTSHPRIFGVSVLAQRCVGSVLALMQTCKTATGYFRGDQYLYSALH